MMMMGELEGMETKGKLGVKVFDRHKLITVG